jgi:transcriptional regulator with GAF, ATPase, and Fis domain
MEHRVTQDRGVNEAERFRTLLEINNAIISSLTQEALFRAIAQALRRVMAFERTAIFLHDPAPNVLRLFVLESSLASEYFVVGLEMPPGDSHVGRVFREKRSLLRRDLATERQYPMEDRAYADGVRSYIIVPLLVRGDPIGTLAVASTAPNQYTEADVVFLQEVANQVALAVENMKAYERIAALHGKAVAEAAQRRLAEELLREITEGTASVTGSDFFASLVRHLSSALAVRYAFVAECLNRAKTQARTLAFWAGDALGEPFEFSVAGTPCSGVLEGAVCCYASRVQELFPEDLDLVRLGAESYLGVPILDAAGQVIGHMGVLDDKPIQEDPRHIGVMRIFAARAGAELERLRAEESLRRALAEVETLKNRLHAENVYLQEEIRTAHDFVEMVGNSPPLLEVLRKIEKVASTDSTVLICGETGTGKELIARAIHDRSPRKGRPLVKVNCSAISAGLVESELFGHVKGAFTGALERRVGRFELADGGTLFLDEVGELPPETQVKLLRVLQEQEFEPVGSSRPIRVDVRVIAATNRTLEDAIQSGRFRSDLYYRLNVFPLEVPPLRERRADIPQLVMFFLQRFAKKFGKRIEAVSPGTMDLLVGYAWPGNVRELQNIIERAMVLSSGPVLELGPDLLPMSTSAARPQRAEAPATAAAPSRHATLEEMERGHILAVLQQTGGVIQGPKGAAKILGMHPNTLRSRMQKLGIKRAAHEIS